MTSFSTQPTTTGTVVHDHMVGLEQIQRLCAREHKLAILIDERRALAAQVAGKDVEISLALGDRDAARRALAEMKAQIEARRGVREACFFDKQGEIDAAAMKGGARA